MTAEEWNARHPRGTRVLYRSHPTTEPRETATRSEAWELGDGSPIVLILGLSGGVSLGALEVLP